ncbi:MAG: glycine--tRNA ligase [Bacteroidetes bacterium]|nr:glycine--tRNA ligase [Bacteroidota bacterium]
MDDQFKRLISHCKEYGFVFQSSEIYDGLSATYDYGPYGAELKQNLKSYWWRAMTQLNDHIVGLDAAIFMHPKTWTASGHVDAFNDPMIDNKDSKKRYRADQLVEGYVDKLEGKIDREVRKAKKRFGDDFIEEKFRAEHPRVQKYKERIRDIQKELGRLLNTNDLDGVRQMIVDLDIACPVSGSRNWTEVRQFNLMFSTQLGSVAGEEGKLYLRPETAQGIFVNFLPAMKTSRQKIPFGIAQIGKAFRNEIIARQFIFRMREFEQMEMQFFVKPGEEMKWYDHWKEQRLLWYKQLGFDEEVLRIHEHDQLAHYANAALDLEFKYPFGFKELEGIHSRTDFDLSRHQAFSGKKLQVYDHETESSYVPYVVETSVGLDRLFLAMMTKALVEEDVPDADGKTSQRTVLKLPPALAPVKVAVLPLLKNKEELTDLASDVFNQLRPHFQVQYDDKDAIGRRYRRQDAIGTPFCVTVDFESLEDGTVTLRDRDTLKQERIPMADIADRVRSSIGMEEMLTKLV